MQIDTFIDVLKKNNLKITSKRMAVLDVLIANSYRLMTAEEILLKAKKTYSNLNLTTIYRNLEQFIAIGILHRTILKDQMTYYKLSCSEHHHHHLICENCGSVVAIDHCPVEALLPEIDKHQFIMNSHKLEVYGLCNECQS